MSSRPRSAVDSSPTGAHGPARCVIYLDGAGRTLGPLGLATRGRGLAEIIFIEAGEHHREEFADLPKVAAESHPDLAMAVEALRAWEAGTALPAITFDLSACTPFTARVLLACAGVPRGSVCAYADLAKVVDSAPRAVGGALGRNPIPVLIPCHRVMGRDGSLTGFTGGLPVKSALLAIESAPA
jgi:methylated-DNA-[protein]-cysteine S-methyltransferase